jgi:ATP adenylyltransferase
MEFSELKEYLANKIKMSHIYQPVMIKELLSTDNQVPAEQIAKKFLEYDVSQIEYYEQIVKRMPAPVLMSHGIVEKSNYALKISGEPLSAEQRNELIRLCETKLNEYIKQRGPKIWHHRRLSDRIVSGSLRYTVLKQAGFRCQLCGISAEERALEVDHIIPHNLGGSDTLDNFQALCYKCNANKRDTDKTNFKDWKNIYNYSENQCFFCHPDKSRLLEETELAYVIKDGFPVTEKHVLVVPKRHVASFFDLFSPEINSCIRLINRFKEKTNR